jgi:L-seryl-tRNA(Ser) seleniumtransferase
MTSIFSKIPSIDSLLILLNNQTKHIDIRFLKQLIENVIKDIKTHPSHYNLQEKTRDKITSLITDEIENQVNQLLAPSFRRVINGTGVILHTGLGRAPLGPKIISQLDAISAFTNLEINLSDGKRGERLDHITPLLRLITGAEDAIAVNNNAAAVLLILNSLAKRKEVIVSRGELVEIGGSFRLPEVMKNSTAKMVEVGSTNKTHLGDYEEAITDRTSAIMIVHPSNYKIMGFTEKPEATDILSLAHENDLPVIYDLGSGAFLDMQTFGFEYEPVVRDVMDLGFDVVSFSGDKLLGGPQAGIIVGRNKYLTKIRKNHMLRALRCDKTILSLLAIILKQYLHTESIIEGNATLQLFSRTIKQMRTLSERLLSEIEKQHHFYIKVIESEGRAGSGAYPIHSIPAIALQIDKKKYKASKIARKLRLAEIPIFGYILDDYYHLNFLTLMEEDIPHIAASLNKNL